MGIRKFIRNWLYQDNEGPVAEISSDDVSPYPDSDKSLQFKIWFAQGGRVIQTRRYDRHKDQLFTNMYVIHDSQNIGDEIDKIIVKESLYS